MNKKTFSATSLASALLLGMGLLAGCSSQPTLGERMMEQSAGTKEMGQQWQTGNEKVIKGEKLLKEGNEMIKDAREDMREGEDKVSEGKELVEEGKRMMMDSESQYKVKFPDGMVK